MVTRAAERPPVFFASLSCLYNLVIHETRGSCRLSARLSGCLWCSHHGARWARHEDSGRSFPPHYSRISVCQGSEIPGSRVFAGSGALSDEADRSEGKFDQTAELRSGGTSGDGRPHAT